MKKSKEKKQTSEFDKVSSLSVPITTTVRLDYKKLAQKKGVKMNYALNKGLRHVLFGENEQTSHELLRRIEVLAGKLNASMTLNARLMKENDILKEKDRGVNKK